MSELERAQGHAAAPVPTEWTYAPAPESREVVRLDARYGHFVGGEWLEAAETYTTIAPGSEEPLAEVGQATQQEVEQAVGAARAAFENGWSSLLNDVLMQLRKEKAGAYQSPDYFTVD